MNRRNLARLSVVLVYAAIVAAFLASVASHVAAINPAGSAPSDSRFHNLAVRFARHAPGWPALFALALIGTTASVGGAALSAALLRPPPADGFAFALRAHRPLALLLLHPLCAAFHFENLGRRVALAVLAWIAFNLVAGLLARTAWKWTRDLSRRTTDALREAGRELAGWPALVRRLPALFIDHQPLVILFVAALALRLYRIEERSIWWDEFAAFDWNKDSLLELLRVVARFDSHPPLFYLVERLFLFTGGFSIAVSRLPMAIASALAVPAAYLLGLRLFGRLEALAAALLMAFAPFAVVYGQEARMYGMLLALLAFTGLFLFRAVLDGRRLPLLAYAGGLTLCLYTHYMTLPFVAAFLLLPLVLGHRERFPGVLAATLAAFAAFLPWVLAARASPLSGEFAAYLTYWLEPPRADALLRTPLFLLDGPFNPNGAGLFAAAVLPCLLPLYAFALPRGERALLAGLALLVWAPILGEFLLSALFQVTAGAAIFQVKHLIGVLPFLILLIVRAAFLHRSAALRIAHLAAFLAFSLLALLQFFQVDLNVNWTLAARHLDATARPGDAIVCMPDLALASLQTYYKPRPGIAQPASLAPGPGGAAPSQGANPVAGTTEAEAIDRFFADRLAGAPRIQVVIREVGVKYGPLFPRDARLLERIAGAYVLAAATDFDGTPGVRLLRYERDLGPGSAEVEVTFRVDITRLFAFRYFAETGLIAEPPLLMMIDGSTEKLRMRPLGDGIWVATARLPVPAAGPRSFHAVFDTGIKSGLLSRYFYVGESGRFALTGHEAGRTIRYRPSTLQDPFVKAFRDLVAALLALLTLVAWLTPFVLRSCGGRGPGAPTDLPNAEMGVTSA